MRTGKVPTLLRFVLVTLLPILFFLLGLKCGHRNQKKQSQSQKVLTKLQTEPILRVQLAYFPLQAMRLPNSVHLELKISAYKIQSFLSPSSKLMTDEWLGYKGLSTTFEHCTVDHGNGQYVIGDCHTNNIESFWSLLKRGWVGVYHFLSQKHIDAYLNEYEFRHNTRQQGESERFTNLLGVSEGRLTYKQLIK